MTGDISILIKASIISNNYREAYIDSLSNQAYFIKNNDKIIKFSYAQKIMQLKKLVYNDIILKNTVDIAPLDYYIEKIEKIEN